MGNPHSVRIEEKRETSIVVETEPQMNNRWAQLILGPTMFPMFFCREEEVGSSAR